MKIVFFGTPDYVLPIVDKLNKKFKSNAGESPITAVVTAAPKPTGRKQELAYSPVDDWAHKRGIPKFFEPFDIIKNKIVADIGILASYGKLIPSEVINHFSYGILNVHPSLLPNFRGSSPVQATLVSASPAGATIIKIDDKLDHGPIISQFKEDLLPEDTTETLRRRLFERSAEVLETLIPAYIAGKITPKPQEHNKAIFTKEITKDDGFIPPKYLLTALKGKTARDKWRIPFIKDYSMVPNANSLERFIRAMQPWPEAWTEAKVTSDKKHVSKRLKILKSHISQPTSINPQLALDEVQLEGKSPVSWKQFLEGYPNAKFV